MPRKSGTSKSPARKAATPKSEPKRATASSKSPARSRSTSRGRGRPPGSTGKKPASAKSPPKKAPASAKKQRSAPQTPSRSRSRSRGRPAKAAAVSPSVTSSSSRAPPPASTSTTRRISPLSSVRIRPFSASAASLLQQSPRARVAPARGGCSYAECLYAPFRKLAAWSRQQPLSRRDVLVISLVVALFAAFYYAVYVRPQYYREMATFWQAQYNAATKYLQQATSSQK